MFDPEFYGCVLFDSELDADRGFWCRCGGEPVRFETLSDIPQNGLWWTNMTWQPFYRDTAAGKFGHLRQDRYLPIGIEAAVEENGLDPAASPREEVCARAALLFGRTMVWASRLLAEAAPDIPEGERFRGQSLRDDFAPLFGELDWPRDDERFALAEGQAFRVVTATPARAKPGQVRAMLRRPRARHALDMLGSPSPLGPWRWVDGVLLPPFEEAMASSRPMLFKIAIEDAQPRLNDVFGFNVLGGDTRLLRSWVPHLELDAVRRMARVSAKGAWVGGSYRPLGAMLPPAVDPFVESAAARFSWSIGIGLTALWQAVLKPAGRRDRLAEERRTVLSWQGVWAKSADKLILCRYANELIERGYDVLSYGFGWVHCAVAEERLGDLLQDAAELGLVPRMTLLEHGMDMPAWGGDAKDEFAARLVYGRDASLLDLFDGLALEPPGAQEQSLRGLLERLPGEA